MIDPLKCRNIDQIRTHRSVLALTEDDFTAFTESLRDVQTDPFPGAVMGAFYASLTMNARTGMRGWPDEYPDLLRASILQLTLRDTPGSTE